VPNENPMSRDEDPEHILVPLADGFEEIEAVTIIDILRRAGLDVTVASLRGKSARGSHAIEIASEAELGSLDLSRFTMIVLPGGMAGTRELMGDERILALVRRLHREGRRTAAICAAPLVLHAAGVIERVAVTAHPSVQAELSGADVKREPRVVRSGALITSQGAGTALEFALALVGDLCGAEKAREIARAIVAAPAS
jgi:4-methyl-5(b-hydroxyethyl)-thiazole monophosphate biosynthesis